MFTPLHEIKNWYVHLPEKRKVRIAVVLLLLASIVSWNEVIVLFMFVALFWHEYEALKAGARNVLLQRSSWLMVVVPVVLFFSIAVLKQPAAYDDLLRNIVVWHYGYDYRKMFPDTGIYSWSLWYGFDRLLGLIGPYLEPKFVMWLVQGTAAVAMLVVLYAAGNRCIEDREDKIYWIAVFVWLAFVISLSRIALGRPEIFMSIWLLAAVIPRRPIHILWWAACGFVFSTGYWLAFLYFPAVILLRTSLRTKIAIGVAFLIFHLIFWNWVSDGEYLGSLLWLKHVLANEIKDEGVVVSENVSILSGFLDPLFAALFFIAVVGTLTARQKPWPLVLIVIYFFLSNQDRYIGTVAPLLAVLAWLVWKDRLPPLSAAARGTVFGLIVTVIYYSAFSLKGMSGLPLFKLPNEAKVLTAFGPATYSVVFSNPGTVQTAPAFAVGASPKEVQRLSIGISKGVIDCVRAKRWGYSHIIENTLKGQSPTCLSLVATQDEWRLWEVK